MNGGHSLSFSIGQLPDTTLTRPSYTDALLGGGSWERAFVRGGQADRCGRDSMSSTKDEGLSRRDWMGLVTKPALAASVAPVAALTAAAAADPIPPAGAPDRGARVHNVR